MKNPYEVPANFFRILGDPTRLRILTLLKEESRYVGEICALVELAQPAVSHHLCLMRMAGVIQAKRQGKQNFYSLTEAYAPIINGVLPAVGLESEAKAEATAVAKRIARLKEKSSVAAQAPVAARAPAAIPNLGRRG